MVGGSTRERSGTGSFIIIFRNLFVLLSLFLGMYFYHYFQLFLLFIFVVYLRGWRGRAVTVTLWGRFFYFFVYFSFFFYSFGGGPPVVLWGRFFCHFHYYWMTRGIKRIIFFIIITG